MKFSRTIFLGIICISLHMDAMEAPPKVGAKRPAEEEIEILQEEKSPRAEPSIESTELPASLAERLEPVSGELISTPAVGLQDLPNELVAKVTSLITAAGARGGTTDQKLISAAMDINNLAIINKAFREFFRSDYIQLQIIKELASKYAQGDLYAAAFALATDEASGMIGATLNDAIAYNEDDSVFEVQNAYVVTHFKEYLVNAIKRKKEDAWRFFTKHVNPSKLAFIIDNLMIDGKPALLYVIETGNKEMLGKILAVEDINYEKPDSVGHTPLMAAATTNNTDLLRFLINQDVNIDLDDTYGNTALLFAVANGSIENVNLLLAENASVNFITEQEERTPLIVAILNNDVPMVQRLLAVPGINVNQVGTPPDFAAVTDSALHHAVQLGNVEIMRLLLNVPNIQLNILNGVGQTPLHIAAINQNAAMIEQLIRAGAQTNIQDAQGMTALMYAARTDNPESIYYLIQPIAHANFALTDNNGHTALWHAQNANKVANAILLRNAQAHG